MKTRIRDPFKPLTGILASTILLLLAVSITPTQAQDKYEKYDVVVEVEGMFCPFCSYSVEKNLNKRKEIKQADVSLLDGVAKLILKQYQEITKEQVTRIGTDAGYETDKFLKFPGETVADTSKSPD